MHSAESDGETRSYSPTWFMSFAERLDSHPRTDAEVRYLARVLPLATHRRILDVPCGRGRHATRLAALGYDVTAADVDAGVLEAARTVLGGRGRVISCDLRDLGPAGRGFDGVINLWQSFGMFDDAGDEAVLHAMARAVRPGGRVVVDIYDPDRFQPTDGVRERAHANGSIEERTSFRNHRLTVSLAYSWTRERDRFEWRLYRRPEITALAASVGLGLLEVGADFDDPAACAGGAPRAQYVFER